MNQTEDIMELRQIRYFVAIAHAQHFTRAAAALGIAQPALSQQLRSLERELGVTLLQRTSRRVQLTAAGEGLLPPAQPALSQQLRPLERELGVTLLQRTSRRVQLTAAGEVFLARAEQLLADAD